MITKRELCEHKLKDYAHRELKMPFPIDINKIPESVAVDNSTAGICMEYLGLIKDPALKEYVHNRGGLFVISHDDSMEPVIVSFRDILESMKE